MSSPDPTAPTVAAWPDTAATPARMDPMMGSPASIDAASGGPGLRGRTSAACERRRGAGVPESRSTSRQGAARLRYRVREPGALTDSDPQAIVTRRRSSASIRRTGLVRSRPGERRGCSAPPLGVGTRRAPAVARRCGRWHAAVAGTRPELGPVPSGRPSRRRIDVAVPRRRGRGPASARPHGSACGDLAPRCWDADPPTGRRRRLVGALTGRRAGRLFRLRPPTRASCGGIHRGWLRSRRRPARATTCTDGLRRLSTTSGDRSSARPGPAARPTSCGRVDVEPTSGRRLVDRPVGSTTVRTRHWSRADVGRRLTRVRAWAVRGRRPSSATARPRHLHSPRMDRRSALVLLVVFGAGVFLAGLELMITAVALPSILGRPRRPDRRLGLDRAAQGELDHQRLPARVHPDDAPGRPARRPVGRPPAVPRRRSASSSSARALAGPRQNLDQLIAARLVQAVGGGVLVPVGTAAAAHLYGGRRPAARARGHRRADVPRDGRRAVPRRGDPGVGPPGGRARRRRARRAGRRRAPRPGLALDLLRQRADRARRRWSSPGRPRAGWETPAPTRPRRPARAPPGSASRSLAGSSALTLIGATEVAGSDRSTRRP